MNVCTSPLASVTVNVTASPGVRSVVPEIVGVASLPRPSASSVTTGAVVSILPLVEAVPVLPTASVAAASTVKLPSAISAGTSALNVPSGCTVAVTVCASPLASVTVNVTDSPAGRSVVPEIVGVVSLPVPWASSVTVGAVVSILPLVEAVPVFPAASVAAASTVKLPSAISAGTPALNVPSGCTVAVTVCTSPFASVTVSVTDSPAGRSVVPEIVGVVSLPVPCASSVTVGAVVSTVPEVEAVPVLPAASVAAASTVKLPSAISAGTSALNVPSG